MKTRSLLTKKTAARFLEMETALELELGEGIAETVLGNILDDAKRGEVSLIMEGWEFDDRAKAERKLAQLGARWAREDADEASVNSREGVAA